MVQTRLINFGADNCVLAGRASAISRALSTCNGEHGSKHGKHEHHHFLSVLLGITQKGCCLFFVSIPIAGAEAVDLDTSI